MTFKKYNIIFYLNKTPLTYALQAFGLMQEQRKNVMVESHMHYTAACSGERR